jgi:hypothetical protein
MPDETKVLRHVEKSLFAISHYENGEKLPKLQNRIHKSTMVRWLCQYKQ